MFFLQPFTPSVAPVTDFAEWVLEDASATEILTSKTVVLSQALNLKVLMPYFVENRCLTLAEMRNFKCERAFDQEENMQFIEIVSKRGSAAFQGLIKAIDQYTAKEPGEGALIELSNKLRADMKKVGAPRPGPSAPEPASGGDAGVTDSDKAKLAVDDGGEDGQKKRKVNLLYTYYHSLDTPPCCTRDSLQQFMYFYDTGYVTSSGKGYIPLGGK